MSLLFRLKNLLLGPLRRRRFQASIYRQARQAASSLGLGVPTPLLLPVGYGRGLNERVVETLLARLIFRPGMHVLDVGHANAMPCHLAMIADLPKPARVVGIDISEVHPNTARYYAESIRGDIASAPFPSGSFDCIWCISALEHFGFDNSHYTQQFEHDPSLAYKAMAEMIRLIRRTGTILITVPFGRYENHGWFMQYDREHWDALMNVIPDSMEKRCWFFQHTYSSGWQVVDPVVLEHTGYADQNNCGAAGLAAAALSYRVASSG